MSDRTAAIVEEVAGAMPDPRDTVPETDRPEYDKLVRRHGFRPGAALAILRGRAQARAQAEAEPIADAVIRSMTGQPPRTELPEADSIVQAIRR